ncbi:MAG: hypothetical protein NZM04_02555 [Methylacidiphilales bacterium]|nr:hypothetical protein [Candidatus Methylacidiphilales bacterium]
MPWLPPIPQPPTDDDTVVEFDELFTLSRDEAMLQAVVDQGPRAFQYCTNGFSGYAALDYRGGCL